MSAVFLRTALVLATAALATAHKGEIVVEAADGGKPVAFTAVLTSRLHARSDTVHGTTPARLALWRIDRLYERVELWSDVPGRAVVLPPANFRQGLPALTGLTA